MLIDKIFHCCLIDFQFRNIIPHWLHYLCHLFLDFFRIQNKSEKLIFNFLYALFLVFNFLNHQLIIFFSNIYFFHYFFNCILFIFPHFYHILTQNLQFVQQQIILILKLSFLMTEYLFFQFLINSLKQLFFGFSITVYLFNYLRRNLL